MSDSTDSIWEKRHKPIIAYTIAVTVAVIIISLVVHSYRDQTNELALSWIDKSVEERSKGFELARQAREFDLQSSPAAIKHKQDLERITLLHTQELEKLKEHINQQTRLSKQQLENKLKEMERRVSLLKDYHELQHSHGSTIQEMQNELFPPDEN